MIAATDVVAAIRADHLKANIGAHEADPYATIYWSQATMDRGGTIFGPGPYLKVPVLANLELTMCRVYAPARLRRRLAKLWERAEKPV